MIINFNIVTTGSLLFGEILKITLNFQWFGNKTRDRDVIMYRVYSIQLSGNALFTNGAIHQILDVCQPIITSLRPFNAINSITIDSLALNLNSLSQS